MRPPYLGGRAIQAGTSGLGGVASARFAWCLRRPGGPVLASIDGGPGQDFGPGGLELRALRGVCVARAGSALEPNYSNYDWDVGLGVGCGRPALCLRAIHCRMQASKLTTRLVSCLSSAALAQPTWARDAQAKVWARLRTSPRRCPERVGGTWQESNIAAGDFEHKVEQPQGHCDPDVTKVERHAQRTLADFTSPGTTQGRRLIDICHGQPRVLLGVSAVRVRAREERL